jgi:periplasmic protein TonB
LGLEGSVRLRVAIARDGSIEDVKALSGDPLLAEAAIAAVKQWRYRPIILDGKPVPALTVITITFRRP